jgi:uncharacterized protein (DUF305 family)
MTRTTARLTGLAGALVAGTLVLTGCGDDTAGHNGHSAGSNTPASTSTGAEATHNDADFAFASGMRPHHESAIEMAELAEGRAADPRVLDLAGRIKAAQAPEIETLTGWLTEWGADAASSTVMDHGGHDMGDMGGMDMSTLMNTSGADFDRMFLTQMISHHRAAVDMAVTEAADGQNADAIALAEDIRDSQSAEISGMQTLLTELGG